MPAHAYIEREFFKILPVFLLIAGGCALLICLGCGYVSRQFTRPLIQMAGLADRIVSWISLQYTSKEDGDELTSG